MAGDISFSIEEHAEARLAHEKSNAAAISKAWSLYNDGVPLFTKEAIHDVYRQIKASDETRCPISIREIDGNIVVFELQTGYSYPTREPGIERF